MIRKNRPPKIVLCIFGLFVFSFIFLKKLNIACVYIAYDIVHTGNGRFKSVEFAINQASHRNATLLIQEALIQIITEQI